MPLKIHWRCFVLTALVLGVVTLGIFGASRGDLQNRIVQLQRQGSCTDLPIIGVNTHRGRNPDDINVRLVSDLNARMVRLEIAWIDLERHGQFNFAAFDSLVSKLRQSGKTIVFGLAYGHPDHSDGRAANGFPLPPRTSEQRAAYSSYAQAVAKRYHGPDIVYEIWNEPNLAGFWPPVPDAEAYGKLLDEAAAAIRNVQPAATIISGGLANENDPPKFLKVLSQMGALHAVDGIAFHPYRVDAPEKSLISIHDFESAAGEATNRPVWLTEWGYSDTWLAKPPLRPRQRGAILIARLMLTAALARAKAVTHLRFDRRR